MAVPKIRCAVYTRKSSEEGLDQSFNSLDAQYEACAAYVSSQKHEGWVLAHDRFDDGGVSGGTLERPALARLLAEIEARRIAMVVVYKIDRLTRSLTDFAKLVERFDAAGCSFVSVTQAFNTASSMGRLTLNVLLSFAQFEREVTAERIRDKIAASKKQGLWMGGLPPLGYDPHPDTMVRELVMNVAEAETVRSLFTLYDEHGNITSVAREAAALQLRSKHHRFGSGREQGGCPLSTGQIHKILTNPVYRGLIRHKDWVWPGRHPAIVDEALWERVQAKLQAAARRPRGRRSDAETACLTGKLRDQTGDRLTPTHSLKAGRRHSYYISNRLISGGPDPTGWRLPARMLEARVAIAIADHIGQAVVEHRLLAMPDLRADPGLLEVARDLVRKLRAREPELLQRILVSGSISSGEITLKLDPEFLEEALHVAQDDLACDLLVFSVPVQLRRRGVEAKLVAGKEQSDPDPVLLRTLADAHRWVTALRNGTPLSRIAQDAGHHDVFIRTRGPLAFLSPRIQRAILEGTLPPELTLRRFLQRPIPLDWHEQERIYGI
ncbi:recombinase family protein [Aestuariicoccus sp. MJ-SS9]|uniref:recombinase family protein n=1 Tax=Aestuariicoccus sp. MJ-SS9 TaxID=3079855 RepID=UPI002910078E|nr:recombinase family protein [Aestuariicoccus sp. MJ-SS9]MDU8913209.1 recombinase family protein [Aestuariicoccus sp. MJ-SS9]